MTDCVVLYDLLLNASKYNPDEPRPRRTLWTNGHHIGQPGLCCDAMKECYEEFVNGDPTDTDTGMFLNIYIYGSYEGGEHMVPLHCCPFCGSVIVYQLRKKIRRVVTVKTVDTTEEMEVMA